jgi:hypothetical protein
MGLSLRDWRPRHLLAAWGAYWAALAVAVLGRPAMLAWQLANRPEGAGAGTGTASVSFENAVLKASIVEHAGAAWSGTAHLATIGLWIAGPPLLLWLLWLVLRPRAAGVVGAGAPTARLRDAGLSDLERAAVARAERERTAREP